MVQRSYFTFPSVYYAVKAEKTLLGKEWEFRMVPVPRSISSSCGTALQCQPEDAPFIREHLEECSVEVENLYALNEESSSPLWGLFSRKKKKGGQNER